MKPGMILVGIIANEASPGAGTVSNNIVDEMYRQLQNLTSENFGCDSCKNYEGSLVCKQRVFIAFKGANMSNCLFYQRGTLCPQCRQVK